MIVTSHQPNFLPYMGVFYKAFKSDIIVLSDDVQFSKKGMHNYNLIRTKDGSQKITIPVNSHHDIRLCDVMVSEPKRSIPKVVRTLKEAYTKTEHYDDGMEILSIIEDAADENLRLTNLNTAIIRHIFKRMGIKAHILIATEDLSLLGHKDDRILMMCQQTKGKTYYSGTGSKAYHNEERYRKNGINLVYSDYRPSAYQQKYEPFLPNLSVIDYVFNEGYKIPEAWL